jgi:hypothetical protein
VIQQVLIELGLGTDPDTDPGEAWPVYSGSEPGGQDAPDNCLTVYDTDPKPDGRSMLDGETWQHYGLQIRIFAHFGRSDRECSSPSRWMW